MNYIYSSFGIITAAEIWAAGFNKHNFCQKYTGRFWEDGSTDKQTT